MSEPAAEFNPYRAPASGPGPDAGVRLEAGTAFLVSTTAVLCGDTLEFPPVCIRTAVRTDLVNVRRTLKWSSHRLQIGAYLCLMMTTFQFPNITAMIRQQFRVQSPAGISTLTALGFATAGVTLLTLAHRGRRRVAASWFISRTEFERERRRRRIGLLLMVICGIAIPFSLYYGPSILDGELMFFVTSLAPIFVFSFGVQLWRRSEPRISGVRDGLNVVEDLPPVFTEALLAIIDAANARHEAATAGE
ncbi:MAG: hypothetical protein R3C19_26450 [Planctomycetaceae bacterium]